MASHVSVDLTKQAGIQTVNFNEADLITCFANDYGYENWVAKAVEFYGDQGDVLIVISSSGKSKNMINATVSARTKKFSKIVTLSGFAEDNPLRKSGDIMDQKRTQTYRTITRSDSYVLSIHTIYVENARSGKA